MTELYSTLYSTPDRVILAAWCSICLLAGVIGNILTLTTSRSLIPTGDVDRFTTTILRNLAISDLMYLFTRILPSLCSHLLGGWKLGESVCTFEGSIYIIPVLAGMAFISCLSMVKVFVCMLPLRANHLTTNTARAVSIVIWVQAAIPSFIAFFGGVKVNVNKEVETICEISVSSPLGRIVGIIHNVQIWIPSLLILPCNLALWFLAHKHTKNHNLSSKKAITTILSISFLFILSWIPTVLEEGWRVFTKDPHIPLWFNKAHINFYFISSFGNPLLYALINRRYREKIKDALQLHSRSVEGRRRTGSPKRSRRPWSWSKNSKHDRSSVSMQKCINNSI